MKVRWMLPAILLFLLTGSRAYPFNDPSLTIDKLINDQCEFAGGLQKGFCTCLITAHDEVKIAESILQTVKSKKVNTKSAMIINPFAQTCPGHNTKLGSETLLRLTYLSWLAAKHLQHNDELVEEIKVLTQLGLLDLDKILEYMQSQGLKKEIHAKLQEIKTIENWSTKGLTNKVKASGTNQVRLATYEKLSELTGFDVQLTQEMINDLYPKMRVELIGLKGQVMSKQAISHLIKNSWQNAKTFAKNSLGHVKGSVVGVARGAVIETSRMLLGYDLSFLDYLDPIQLFVLTVTPTAAQASTIGSMLADEPLHFLIKKLTDDSPPTFTDVAKALDILYRSGDKQSITTFSAKILNLSAYISKRTQSNNSQSQSLIDSFWIEQ